MPDVVKLVPGIPTNVWAYNLQNVPLASKYNDLTVDVNFARQEGNYTRFARDIYVTDQNGQTILHKTYYADIDSNGNGVAPYHQSPKQSRSQILSQLQSRRQRQNQIRKIQLSQLNLVKLRPLSRTLM